MNETPAARGIGRGPYAGPPLPPKSLIGFMAAIVAVVLIAVLTFQSLKTREEAARLVSNTQQVKENIESLLSLLKDAETGQRGYLLTGAEQYLEPYNAAKSELVNQFTQLRQSTGNNAVQQKRLDTMRNLTAEKMEELEQTIQLRRAGKAQEALALVRTDRGRAAMEGIRSVAQEMEDEERGRLASQQAEWERTVRISFLVTLGGLATLLLLILIAAVLASREYRARQVQAWMREGQMGLSERLQGEQRLEVLGERVLEYLVHLLGAQVGAVYVGRTSAEFLRVAGYAIPPDRSQDRVRPGDGLVGQAMKENRVLHVREVPDGYLPVSSGVGRGNPRELLIAPASVDRSVQAIIELGFFRTLRKEEGELLERMSESFGIAVRTAKDRTRLEELLEETQRQAEELQAQQEELKVSNEELEEQSRALRESQVRLENQQSELEQSNSQLEEQASLLEAQKDDLAHSQAVLAEKAAELERSNQYKSEFLANMSHELRTPLNSSLILSKLLADNKDGNLTEEQVKFARTISSAGNDLLTLINDILDLSKIEAGKVDVNAEAVPIAGFMENLQRTFQPMAQQKGIGFILQVDARAPERIETDAQRLGQILKNLLSNAFKFTERGEVAVRVSKTKDGSVAFAVKDTGIGIAVHQHDVIFEAFRQADGSTHRKYGGTGLGLSISRDLARLLGGDITVESELSRGSLFTLKLPEKYTAKPQASVGDSHAPVPARTVEAAASPAPRAPAMAAMAMDDDRAVLAQDSRLILVVEDDQRFAAILRDLARELGFQCVVTHSASDALTAARLYRPKAILLDINLPDHSGLGVLDQLKRDPALRHIPVHVASVADFSKEALGLGAIGYSLKPVKREELVGALRRLEEKFSQSLRRVLVVEDDERQRESIRHLLEGADVDIDLAGTAAEALKRLKAATFDCVVMDLNLPDLSGYELLEKMAEEEAVSFPPVIVYTGRSLSRDEEQKLRRFSKSIIIKDARSPERLLDEVTLFLHQVEANLPPEHQRMLKVARDREVALEGRRVLVVEDDVRNIFALSSVLEPKGAIVQIARNGREALEALAKSTANPAVAIDLVLMDIMMPEMDGFTAMREIRKQPAWQKLPIIALTAKAMRDDQEKCLAAGANDYIAKPLDVEKLLSLVRVWMPK